MKVKVFCIIEAPNAILAEKTGAQRIGTIWQFSRHPGKGEELVLYLDQTNAAAIVCEIKNIVRMVPRLREREEPVCEYVAWMRLLKPDDFKRVSVMDCWTKYAT